MSLYRKLLNKPSLFLATTGMHRSDFLRLMPDFEKAYAIREAERKSRLVGTGLARKRNPGAGPAFKTSIEERLLMLLIYYRMYLTQEFMTLLFPVEHKATICRALQQMRPVFEAVLPIPERALKSVLELAKAETERRKKRINSVEEFLQEYPELSILIDGVEQPKRRPKDKARRKADYSGKKKRHTLKQIVTATPNGLILDQSPSCGGRRHDYWLFKQHQAQAGAKLMDQLRGLRVDCYVDSAFSGMEKLNLPVKTRRVEQARRGHPLSAEQKHLNRVRARERVKVEHALARRKKYRIAAEVYRNPDQDYDPVMNVVAGLVNQRIYHHLEQQTGIDLRAFGF